MIGRFLCRIHLHRWRVTHQTPTRLVCTCLRCYATSIVRVET